MTLEREVGVGWGRTEELETLKTNFVASLETAGLGVVDWILQTVLCGDDFAIVRQLFPYTLPENVSHWMLWGSTKDPISSQRVQLIVADWVARSKSAVVTRWTTIEFSEQGQSVPQLYHAHLFFETRHAEMPSSSLHEPCAVAVAAAREQPERDSSVSSSSSDAVEVTFDSAVLPTPPPPPPPPPLSTSTTRAVFATKEIASRHLKELFPNSRTIRVVSIILDRLE
jgi:hypothetical protein